MQIIHSYLFGDVKFLDLLMVLMACDILTGVLRAIKEKRLRSRNALYGYARKVGVFAIIIVANVVDIILGLKGAVAVATVIFYLVNEALSIVENLSQIGVPVPGFIQDKLHVMQETQEKTIEVPIVTDKVVIHKEEV
ncbi:phage holin family protein [Metabacillus sp. GX 13764]|uniref:phage holin family protein n=1 Tax=Metabacillus kandeliae TaxID=2900151 RepID=UPI001E645EB0|nr:phage holin family protein [Metabacillus kandeliae]MCD7034300.1 phage holin family protein [Metabacillus kandeliae]